MMPEEKYMNVTDSETNLKSGEPGPFKLLGVPEIETSYHIAAQYSDPALLVLVYIRLQTSRETELLMPQNLGVSSESSSLPRKRYRKQSYQQGRDPIEFMLMADLIKVKFLSLV